MMADCTQAIAAAARALGRGHEVLFHGTRLPHAIIREDRIRMSPSGQLAVSLTRSPEVAAYWAMLERDHEDGEGAVLVLDRRILQTRYRLEPFHDPVWDLLGEADEAEERIVGRDLEEISSFLIGVAWTRDFGPETAFRRS